MYWFVVSLLKVIQYKNMYMNFLKSSVCKCLSEVFVIVLSN